MKKLLFIAIAIFISFTSFAQANSNSEPQTSQSSYERFIGANRNIIKIYTFQTPKLYCKKSISINTEIKKVVLQDDSNYYYHLSFYEYRIKQTYSTSLTYKELTDLLNAIEILINDSKIDMFIPNVSIENYFKTKDGFKLGYYTNGGTLEWFINLNNYVYSSNKIKDINQIVLGLINAKSKIESLM